MKMQVIGYRCRAMRCQKAAAELLSQIRNELNASWLQLRELLTTFRLQLTEPGLRPALEASCERVQRQIWLPGEAGLSIAASSGAFASGNHLLQIAREGIGNALKHPQTRKVVVTVAQNDNQVKLTVQDNGCGVPENAIRSNHYGMIMRDRAQSLRGRLPRPPS